MFFQPVASALIKSTPRGSITRDIHNQQLVILVEKWLERIANGRCGHVGLDNPGAIKMVPPCSKGLNSIYQLIVVLALRV